MSRCHIPYDFFADGRADAFSEVCLLCACGQWTKERRAEWTKDAQSIYARLKHDPQSPHEGVRYYAGRVAALKSRRTAKYPETLKPLPEYQTGWAWCGDEDNLGVTHSTMHESGICSLCCLPCVPTEHSRSLAQTTQAELSLAVDLFFAAVLCLVALPFLLGMVTIHALVLLVVLLMDDDDHKKS